MTEMLGPFSVWLTAIIDPIGALIIVSMMIFDHRYQIAPAWHRYGLMFLAVGLLGQTARSWQTLLTGDSPTDIEMPFWIFKDIGIVVLATAWAVLAIIAHKKSPQRGAK